MVTVTMTSFEKLNNVGYTEARSQFFTDKYNEALAKMKYWSSRTSEDNVISEKATCLAADWGAQVSYYNDAIDALDKSGVTSYRRHRCDHCDHWSFRVPKYCPNCGFEVENES